MTDKPISQVAQTKDGLGLTFQELVTPVSGKRAFLGDFSRACARIFPGNKDEENEQSTWQWLCCEYPEIYYAFFDVKSLCPSAFSHAFQVVQGERFFSLSSRNTNFIDPACSVCLLAQNDGTFTRAPDAELRRMLAGEVPHDIYNQAINHGWIDVKAQPDPLTGKEIRVLEPGPTQPEKASFLSNLFYAIGK